MYENIYPLMMTKDNPAPFTLPHWIALAPFEEFLGMQIESAAEGKAVLTMPFRAALCQGVGLMHGGAVTALADTALAMAMKSILPEGTHFVTTEMKLKFHAPVRWGMLRAIARVTDRHDRELVGEVELITEERITAATFRAVFRIPRDRRGAPPKRAQPARDQPAPAACSWLWLLFILFNEQPIALGKVCRYTLFG